MEKTREINVLALLKALLRKAWIIVLCAIIFGIGGYFLREVPYGTKEKRTGTD